MKTILIPIDFSETANHAADFGLSLAQMLESKLVFLNVIQPMPDTYNVPAMLPQEMTEMKNTLEMSMEGFKKDFINHHKGSNKVHFPQIKTKVVYGNVNFMITDIAKEIDADFIVMGTEGANNTLDKLIGSNAYDVAKNASCPVWIIPKNTKLHAIKNIIYASDLEGDEIECIDKVIDISEMIGAKVKAVHFHEENEPEVFSSKEIIDNIKNDFFGKLTSFKNINHEDVVKGLDTYISNQKPDAVVLAHKERNFLENLFHKSIIKHLTFMARVPLLILQKKE